MRPWWGLIRYACISCEPCNFTLNTIFQDFVFSYFKQERQCPYNYRLLKLLFGITKLKTFIMFRLFLHLNYCHWSTVYNMSDRVLSDIQTRKRESSKWLVKLSNFVDLLAKLFWKYISYKTRKSMLKYKIKRNLYHIYMQTLLRSWFLLCFRDELLMSFKMLVNN